MPTLRENRARPFHSQFTYADAEEIRSEYAAGRTQVELAKERGTTQATISRIVHRQVLTSPTARRPTDRRYTPEQIQQMRYRLMMGDTLAQVGQANDCSPALVRLIRDRAAYRDVPPGPDELRMEDHARKAQERVVEAKAAVKLGRPPGWK